MEILNANFIIFCEREGISNSTVREEKETFYLKKFKVQMGVRSGAILALATVGQPHLHISGPATEGIDSSNPHNLDYVHSYWKMKKHFKKLLLICCHLVVLSTAQL